MYSLYIILILLLIWAIHFAMEGSLPPSFKKCSVKDHKFNECVTSAIQDSLIKLRTGMTKPSFPTLEPLEIPSMFISVANKGPINVDHMYKDVKMYGLTYLKIQKLNFDLNRMTLDFETTGSDLTMTAIYDICGTGPITIAIFNPHAVHHVEFEELERKGKKYYKAIKYNLWMDAHEYKFVLENFFGCKDNLDYAMYTTLNQYESDIYLDLTKGYEASLSKIFKELTNKIFTKVPLNKMFIFE